LSDRRKFLEIGSLHFFFRTLISSSHFIKLLAFCLNIIAPDPVRSEGSFISIFTLRLSCQLFLHWCFPPHLLYCVFKFAEEFILFPHQSAFWCWVLNTLFPPFRLFLLPRFFFRSVVLPLNDARVYRLKFWKRLVPSVVLPVFSKARRRLISPPFPLLSSSP